MSTHVSSGGLLVSADGRQLPLLSTGLRAEARGGLCRIILEQRFQNPYAEPLSVTYQVPLPADGAVSGYAFVLGDKRIAGEVDRKAAARERFERAIIEGRTAGIVEQDRSSLFTQELGNLPPGAPLTAELTIDQKLGWLPEGAWEWRFPTVVAPRYLGEEGRVPDAGRVTVEVADAPLSPRASLALSIGDEVTAGARPESPSHAVRAVQQSGRWEVGFTEESGARLDRDVVVRWAAVGQEAGISLSVNRPAAGKPHAERAYGLLTVVPPAASAEPEALPRDLILLIDSSGSMGGEPLDQARRVLSALVDSLTDQDQLEMIAFSDVPRRWRRGAVEATASAKQDALKWLKALSASGGTEMRTGILEALAPLREDAQRQIVLATDGLIGFEDEVIRTIYDRKPRLSRVHVLGVGSAVNRSLSMPAARAGRGVELICAVGEDPERAAQRLVARTRAPVLTEVSVSGTALLSCAPKFLPDVFGGAPCLISVAVDPRGGVLTVTGRAATGTFERRLSVPAVAESEGNPAVAALFARESVEDLELDLAVGSGVKGELDQSIETLGLQFQISTRLTTWVAVTTERTVDPNAPTRRETIPQELPHGMSVEGLGLRSGRGTGPGALSKAKGAGGLRQQMQRTMAAPPPAEDMDDLAMELESPEPAPELLKRESPRPASRAPTARPAPPPAAAPPPPQRAKRRDVAGEAAERTRPRQPRRLRGRLLVRSGRELVLEIAVDGNGLHWAPPAEATVQTADGASHIAAVDPARSTRGISAGAGMQLRVTLTLPADVAAAPSRVYLEIGGELVEVVL